MYFQDRFFTDTQWSAVLPFSNGALPRQPSRAVSDGASGYLLPVSTHGRVEKLSGDLWCPEKSGDVPHCNEMIDLRGFQELFDLLI